MKYLNAAKKAFGAFLIDYEQGCLVTTKDNDSLVLQELAKKDYPNTDILKGHKFSLISLTKY